MAVAQTGGNPRDAFRAAFEQAVEQHGTPNPNAHLNTDTDTDDESDDVDDDTDEGDGDETDDGEDSEESEAGDENAEAESESEEPPGTKTVEAKDTKGAKTKKGAKAGDEDESLITDEEYAKLQAKHKNDPVALRKALEGVFTQKTQKLAERRRSYERLSKYEGLIDGLETDTEGTLRQIADANGIDLSKVAKSEATTDDSATGEEAVEALLADFKANLGPELEYLADALAPALTKFVSQLAAKDIEKAVTPLRQSTTGLLDKVANEQTDAIMTAFEKQYPDWKDHEDAMMSLGAELQPAKGMTALKYMEQLYKLATRDAWEADRETNTDRAADGKFKKRIEKITRNAAETERPRSATPEGQIRKRPRGPVSFQQAAKDAVRGIRYDDDDDDDD